MLPHVCDGTASGSAAEPIIPAACGAPPSRVPGRGPRSRSQLAHTGGFGCCDYCTAPGRAASKAPLPRVQAPFTVSHAVVAPALSRWSGGRLPASAAAIGAMAPDLEYLAFLETRRTIGHTPLGLLLFCLPVSVLLLWVWHRVVKGPLGQLLPDRWAHLRPALDRPFPFGSSQERALAAVAAIVLGAASHIAWDAFTHAGGAGVSLIPQLRNPVPVVGLHAYAALQYASGVFGLLLLGLSIVIWARSEPPRPVPMPPARHRVVAVLAIVSSSLVVAGGNVARTVGEGTTDRRLVLIAVVLGGMTRVAMAGLAYAATVGRRVGAT